MEPPFIPRIKGKDDFGNFDKAFLREPVLETPVNPIDDSQKRELMYEGFTYQRKMEDVKKFNQN